MRVQWFSWTEWTDFSQGLCVGFLQLQSGPLAHFFLVTLTSESARETIPPLPVLRDEAGANWPCDPHPPQSSLFSSNSMSITHGPGEAGLGSQVSREAPVALWEFYIPGSWTACRGGWGRSYPEGCGESHCRVSHLMPQVEAESLGEPQSPAGALSSRPLAPGLAGCFHGRTWDGTGHRMLLGVSSHTSAGRNQAPSLPGVWARLLSMMLLRVEVWGTLGCWD